MCEDEGFSFYQTPGQTPFLHKKVGIKDIHVTCPMTHHVPYLTSIVDSERKLRASTFSDSAFSGVKEKKKKTKQSESSAKDVVKVEEPPVPVIPKGRPKSKVP